MNRLYGMVIDRWPAETSVCWLSV